MGVLSEKTPDDGQKHIKNSRKLYGDGIIIPSPFLCPYLCIAISKQAVAVQGLSPRANNIKLNKLKLWDKTFKYLTTRCSGIFGH